MAFLIALLFIYIPFYVYSNYFSKNQEAIEISQEVNKIIEKNLENNIQKTDESSEMNYQQPYVEKKWLKYNHNDGIDFNPEETNIVMNKKNAGVRINFFQ